MEARVASWGEAKEIAEREVERRLQGKIVDEWVDTVKLEPRWAGDIWVVRLKVIVRHGALSKKGYLASMKIDPYTGEVSEFQAKPAR